ncbi:phage integrase central domain-containing protein [Burkholderia anthina]|uniref:phage integrase central domain-containing protein n=1 Tax=Burkholderia anthina TaxID=179879 RepID=UPI003C79CD88
MTYAYPIIGALRPNDIDTDLVRKMLEQVWLTKNEIASRVRGRIESVLDWAKVRDSENPARWSGHLDQLLAIPAKVQKPKHHGCFLIPKSAYSSRSYMAWPARRRAHLNSRY